MISDPTYRHKVLVRGNHDPRQYSSNVKKSVSGYNEYKGNW